MKHTKKEPLSRPYMVDTLKGGRRAREGGGAFLSTMYGRCAQGRGEREVEGGRSARSREGGAQGREGSMRSINHLPNYKKEKEKNQKKNKKLFSSLSPHTIIVYSVTLRILH